MRLSRFLGMSMLLLPVLAAVPLFTARSETSAVRIDPPALVASYDTGASFSVTSIRLEIVISPMVVLLSST